LKQAAIPELHYCFPRIAFFGLPIPNLQLPLPRKKIAAVKSFCQNRPGYTRQVALAEEFGEVMVHVMPPSFWEEVGLWRGQALLGLLEGAGQLQAT